MSNDQYPKTLLEAVRYFSDAARCVEYMIRLKWPEGKPTCPKCGTDHVGRIATRPGLLRCNSRKCGKQFSVKVGTIFEDSPIGLDKWFVALWSLVNCKNGISSYELARAIGVTQKTGWFILHRLRLVLEATPDGRKLCGTVESDETFIGGKEKNKHKSKRLHKGRGTVGKLIVQGLLEREGEVRVKVVPNQKRGTLQAEMRDHVEPGSHVYTDALASYEGLDGDYVHRVIDHAKAYAVGAVHTNSLENFWSLFKRCIHGTYVQIGERHLPAYLDEQAWRFNRRDENDGNRFNRAASAVVRKRLTYKQLIGEDDNPERCKPEPESSTAATI